MDKHIIIQITGRVQGVLFRKYAKKMAQQFELVGYAKNNDDNSVTIEVCGDSEQIKKLIEWCKSGSKMARVDDVNYTINDKCYKNYKDFKIC